MQYSSDTPVAILLATYNGENYLCEQIDSLINQNYEMWTLYVHDDGSIDGTLQILASYIERYENIVLMKDDISNRGACDSFMWMLENISAEYYMFCDQDDIWEGNKVEKTLQIMKESENTFPNKSILVYGDLMLVNEDNEFIYKSLWDYTKLKAVVGNLEYLKCGNFVTGCTMMLNGLAKKTVLPISTNAVMHDAWIAAKISSCGGVVNAIDTQLIRYRQHSNNVLGAQEYTKSIKSRIKNIKNTFCNSYKYYLMSREVYGISLFFYLYLKFKFFFIVYRF